MNSLVLAMSLSGILDNGWNWAMDNPVWAVLLIAVPVTIALVIALPGGGLLAVLAAVSVGTLVGGGSILYFGNRGGGGGTEADLDTRGIVNALVVSPGNSGTDTLRVEVRFQGDHRPRPETWSRYDMSQKVEGIVSELRVSRPERLALQIKFLNVPERLQETVVEEFRLHEVMLTVQEE